MEEKVLIKAKFKELLILGIINIVCAVLTLFVACFGFPPLAGVTLYFAYFAFMCFWNKNNQVTITNRRIYYSFLFKKGVISLCQIEQVSYDSLFRITRISTGGLSGLRFMCQNHQEVYETVNQLIVDLNRNTFSDEVINKCFSSITEIKKQSNNKQDSQNLSVDELKKFKELLDMGVITQEEFDSKKKQLLGL